MKKKFIFLFAIVMITGVSANNITHSNLKLTGQNTSAGVNNIANYDLVQFDISWENSWRTSSRSDYSSVPGATSAGTTITVGSTTGLRVGMCVTVTAGTGAFAPGSVVVTIPNSTTFTVAIAPTTALSGGSSVVTGVDVKNWDAAWVFVKYRVSVANGGDGLWKHATLHSTGHTAPSGSTLDIGLLTPGTAFNAITNPGLGAFIYRSSDGTGTFSLSGVQLRWDYGANGVADNAIVDIQVFGIEMVYVPQGSFFVGDGADNGIDLEGKFNVYNSKAAFLITSESVPSTLGGNTSGNMRNNNASGMWMPDDFDDVTTKTLPASFPKGYNAFYCMKYEISQQGYVDFLNNLTRIQQVTRVATSIPVGTTSVTNRYVMSNTSSMAYRNGIRCNASIPSSDPVTFYCDYNGNGTGGEAADGQDIACNYLSWLDLAAYLDWSGLRPMTELEFEKACRGTVSPVPNEFAWGTNGITSGIYTLSNSGENDEAIASNYDTYTANYVSAAGATSSFLTITVSSTSGLRKGMPVAVTAGTGTFAMATSVSKINSSTSFDVTTPPTIPLSGGATIVTGYAICGNATYKETTPFGGSLNGPLRVGISAGTSGNTGRITSGASYYGIMEMSGNLLERPVSVGNVAGRSYTGIHGDGALHANGAATVDYWPGINGNSSITTANTIYLGVTGVTEAAGSCYRGGAWNGFSYDLRVSDRYGADATINVRQYPYGGRGIRTAP